MTAASDTGVRPGAGGERLVGMTFDDGPDPVWTPPILRALAGARVQATFFVMSRRAAAHQGVIEAILDGGHEIGLHCARHLRHPQTPRAIIERDTAAALETLASLGLRPSRWRVPWGACAEWTASVARRYRLSLTGWSADTHDWRGDPAPAMLRAVAPDLVPGAVVLMHDGIGPGARRDDSRETARLIGPLAAAIRRRGLETGPLDALDGRSRP